MVMKRPPLLRPASPLRFPGALTLESAKPNLGQKVASGPPTYLSSGATVNRPLPPAGDGHTSIPTTTTQVGSPESRGQRACWAASCPSAPSVLRHPALRPRARPRFCPGTPRVRACACVRLCVCVTEKPRAGTQGMGRRCSDTGSRKQNRRGGRVGLRRPCGPRDTNEAP